MMAEKIIMEEIKDIKPKYMAEIIDFIKYIKTKEAKEENMELTIASEKAMAEYWNTSEEDEAWRNL